MREKTYAVIMAGGKGERFWPLSTASRPKQMLSLVGGRPMLSLAVERLEGLIPPERVLVITTAALEQAAAEAAPMLPRENIVGEPFGRDTAAACALGTALVEARCPEACVCILTADQIIKDLDVFHACLGAGVDLAAGEDIVVTIGIQPRMPSTGFGYIEAGAEHSRADGVRFHKARRFVEKPDNATAEQYVRDGNYYWNSGMFIWRTSVFRRALERHAPALADMMRALQPAAGGASFAGALETEYGKLEKISVDYAVMEKSDNIVMAVGTFEWDDVGSWPALAGHFDTDADGNVVIGECEAMDAMGNVVVSRQRFTALIGVQDLVVVQGEQATLICPRDRAQDVKAMVRRLASCERYRDLL